MQFLEEHILSRFGVPRKIITDNAPAFKYKKMVEFCFKYQIQLGHSTTYYPQGNGLEESSNKSLMRIIKKSLQDNKKASHTKLIHALWVDRINVKKSVAVRIHLCYPEEDGFISSMKSIPHCWKGASTCMGFKGNGNSFLLP